jgi:hypothetical protein
MQFNYKGDKSVDAGFNAAQSAVDFYATNRENSPDFTMLAKEAIKNRSNERRAVIAAEAQVAQTGLKATADIKFDKIDAKTRKEVADIKKPAQRFAGVVAAASTVGGYAVMKKMNDQADAAYDKHSKETQAWIKSALGGAYDKAKPDDPEPLPKPPKLEVPELEDYQTQDSPAPTTDPIGSGGTIKPGGNIAESSGDEPFTKQNVYNYLTKTKGLSKNKAYGLMANIERESSFQTAPVGGDNGNSFGAFQWNNTYGRSDRMMKNVPNWKTNWKGQIDYALSDKQLPEVNKITSTFLGTTFDTPVAAANYFGREWERPADLPGMRSKHAGFVSTYNF